MQNNTAVEHKSRGKEGANEKTFRISVSTGIFEHCPDMLDSLWLFLWYIDKTTKETNGNGIVLGGMPIVDSRPSAQLGVSVKTIRRWRHLLVTKGYIRALRTPYGYCITLLKSKKWNWGPNPVHSSPTSAARDLPKREISTTEESARSGHSDLPIRAERVPDPGIESARNGKYKEDKAVDLTFDSNKDLEAAAKESAAAFESKDVFEKSKAWTAAGFARPIGPPGFRSLWVRTYASMVDGDIAKAMGECADAWEADEGIVPGPFFAALDRIRKRDRATQSTQPSKPQNKNYDVPEEIYA